MASTANKTFTSKMVSLHNAVYLPTADNGGNVQLPRTFASSSNDQHVQPIDKSMQMSQFCSTT